MNLITNGKDGKVPPKIKRIINAYQSPEAEKAAK